MAAPVTLAPETYVVGVVLPVPQPWGDDLTAWRQGFGDPHADRMPAHITLLAPLRFSPAAYARLLAALPEKLAAVPTFDVTIGSIGTFRPVSPVVFLDVHATGDSLRALHAAVLAAAGSPPQRHPFHPHITVAMDLPDAVLDAAAGALSGYQGRWQAVEVAVYLRDSAGIWHEQQRVALPGTDSISH